MYLPTLFSLAVAATLSSAAVINTNTVSDLPADCTSVYTVQPGDNCSKYTIGSKFSNFTFSQLYKWNPQITQACNLFINEALCIATPDYVFVPPMQAASNDIVPQSDFPVPILAGAASNCAKWYFVGSGVRGDVLINNVGITKEEFLGLNTNIASENWENALFAEYFYCVGV